MAHMLRGGTSSEPFISAAAVTKFLKNPDAEPERTRRPKTRRQMKRKIVRGSKGAKARGAILTLRSNDEVQMFVTTKLVQE